MTCDVCKVWRKELDKWDKTKKWHCRLGIHKTDKTKCFHEDKWRVCIYCGTQTASLGDYY